MQNRSMRVVPSGLAVLLALSRSALKGNYFCYDVWGREVNNFVTQIWMLLLERPTHGDCYVTGNFVPGMEYTRVLCK